MQQSIFDVMYPKYKITKPIRLIELFAGYGSQALALKYLGVPFEHWKTCEWAIKSIQAYKDIHFSDIETKLDGLYTTEQLYKILYNKGISQNYNEPMTLEQIKKLGVERAEQILSNIYTTHNLVNIQQVKGKDLEIVDMVSILGDYSYTFPEPIPLELRLRNLLEDNVDEKYYLTNKKDNNLKNKLCDDLIENNMVEEYDILNTNYANARMNEWDKKGIENNDIAPTLTTRCDSLGLVTTDLRIRKLTPRECFRLMGVKDEDFEKCAKNQSDISLYHLAGDSIVVNVLMAIFKEMIE